MMRRLNCDFILGVASVVSTLLDVAISLYWIATALWIGTLYDTALWAFVLRASSKVFSWLDILGLASVGTGTFKSTAFLWVPLLLSLVNAHVNPHLYFLIDVIICVYACMWHP